ncbi:glycosyltransferase family protein, partial [Mangrovicoccus algicola]
SDGRRRMPPAGFCAALLPQLLEAKGDAGARALLRSLPPQRLVILPPARLRDIDTEAELAAARRG